MEKNKNKIINDKQEMLDKLESNFKKLKEK
jgi:hypothetical protein